MNEIEQIQCKCMVEARFVFYDVMVLMVTQQIDFTKNYDLDKWIESIEKYNQPVSESMSNFILFIRKIKIRHENAKKYKTSCCNNCSLHFLMFEKTGNCRCDR